MKVGVLAVQGNFREHAAMLRQLGVEVVEVRLPEQLEGLEHDGEPAQEGGGSRGNHGLPRDYVRT